MLRLLPRGRIGRGVWWFGMVGVAGCAWLSGRGLYALFRDDLFTTLPGQAAQMVAMLAFIWASGALAALRFQDRDMDAAPRVLPVMAINLVKAVLDVLSITGDPAAPNALDDLFHAVLVLVGLWLVVALGVLRGTAGPNRFGEDPRAAPTQGRFPEGPGPA